MKNSKKNPLILLIRRPVKVVTTGLFGDNHTLTHRIVIGTGVMIVGVNVAHLSELFSLGIIKLTFDGIGYLLHGIGAVPFVDLMHNLAQSFSDDGNDESDNDNA